jgi:hypothetical protein
MPKSDDDRTLDVIEDWCGVRPADLSKQLINLWEETRNNPKRPHTSLDFQPDGVEDLIERLKKEFRKPPGRRITLTPRSFDPNGRVKTISDLMDAVGSSDPLDQAPEGTEVAMAASQPAAVDDETARLFRVVKRWSGDYPVHVLEPLIEIWERTRGSAAKPHKKTPFQARGVERLVKELKQEYRSETSPHTAAFAPAGPIADCAGLLRSLHASPAARKKEPRKAAASKKRRG